jgi:SAM-dependent methyltransferase
MGSSLQSAFPAKFDNVPAVLADWTAHVGGLRNKRVLDFGCGEGTSALGVARKHNPARVVGVDINREYLQLAPLAQANGVAVPDNLAFEEIKRGEIATEDRFDFAYSWSVFEHVDQALLPEVLAKLRSKLSPLYYSPEGSHLRDIAFKQWEHLAWQIDRIHRTLYESLDKAHADALWSTFITLNKITAGKLVDDICAAGFSLARERRTTTALTPDASLRSAYAYEALVTEQIVTLFRKG